MLKQKYNFLKMITKQYTIREYCYLATEIGGWKKRKGFIDIAMEAYDGEKVCELVRISIVENISENYNKGEIGLHRCDSSSILWYSI